MTEKFPPVPCAECGASGNEPCVTKSGEEAAKPHAARLELAQTLEGQFQFGNRVDSE